MTESTMLDRIEFAIEMLRSNKVPATNFLTTDTGDWVVAYRLDMSGEKTAKLFADRAFQLVATKSIQVRDKDGCVYRFLPSLGIVI